MIRVGFRAPHAGWQGGRQYFWNLLFALGQAPAIQPVLLARSQADLDDYRELAHVELVPPGWLSASRVPFYAGRAARYLVGSDVVERAVMARARVDLYSHAPPLGRRFGTRWLYWIPDLQHRRLPEQFGRIERLQRDAEMRHAIAHATRVIVSSHAAKRDVLELAGAAAGSRLRVLQFVAQPRAVAFPPIAELAARYRLPDRFLFLPNQFWRHKNHAVVIDALAQLPTDVTVVATGDPNDYRHPDHYAQLVARAARNGVTARFRVLGKVPFAHVVGLMRAAVAVINPSLFEGWSTTVEEARTMGKRLVLSAIDVHREQAPPGARYFEPRDPIALAGELAAVWAESSDGDPAAEAAAALDLPARTAAFAATYAAIANEAIA
ncbi:MAG TPA: glycosyltransferase family 1 protein [Kofleriaceae bacterium]|nr:glycosyltransferase family 1 protein [Kofleriaceae bacterium]